MKTKQDIIEYILAQLREEREQVYKAAMATKEAATHEESKAENKYDTRGLEASYLAGAQAKRTAELDEAIFAYEQLPPRPFDEETPIGIGAIVTLEGEDGSRLYFFGPKEGGMKIPWQSKQLTVITPSSPIGRQLPGTQVGDIIEVERPRGVDELEILDVE